MDVITKFLCLLLIFTLVKEGSTQCPPNTFLIRQVPTGVKVQHKTQWKVTFTNNCNCSKLDVILSCNGFQSVEKIDPQILSKSGDKCFLNYHNPIYAKTSISFTYAWDEKFNFKLFSSGVACS